MAARKLQISGSFLVGLALLMLILPLPWLLAAVAAAAFHEICHYLAIRACSAKGTALRLGAIGAKMDLPPMSRGKEVVCALAGPLGGLSLLVFARWIPRVAICTAMQSLFNLLPIYPLDGGRALQSMLTMLCSPPVCLMLCRTIEVICKVCICLLAIFGSLWLHLGIFPILLAALLLLRGK